jgi:hypothetical protein
MFEPMKEAVKEEGFVEPGVSIGSIQKCRAKEVMI